MDVLSLILFLAAGAVAPPVEVVDQTGKTRAFPDAKQAVLLIYEDQDGGKQNKPAKELLGKLNANPSNRAKVDVLAVADLSKWDWWPARNHALADIRKIATEKKTTIYIDWKGVVRKAWGLGKGKNSLILVEPSGKVRFASEGPLSDEQLKQLLAILTDMGLTTS